MAEHTRQPPLAKLHYSQTEVIKFLYCPKLNPGSHVMHYPEAEQSAQLVEHYSQRSLTI